MSTFDTPKPISIQVDVVGNVRVDASDRTDTVVTVGPLDPAKPADVTAAQETVVEHSGDELVVRTPKHWTRFTPFGGGESVEVTIEVPTGSRLDATTGLGDIHAEGELGACRVRTAMGHLRLDHTGDLRASTSHGDVTVDHVAGDAQASTSSGDVRIGEVSGSAVVKNSNGATEVGAVDGELRVKSGNGDIVVGRAGSSAVAKTANGDVSLFDVRAGTIVAQTACGDLEVGVRNGVTAWLDLHTRYGSVRNDLDASGEPVPGDETVEVRATTPAGDIVVRRATDTTARSVD